MLEGVRVGIKGVAFQSRKKTLLLPSPPNGKNSKESPALSKKWMSHSSATLVIAEHVISTGHNLKWEHFDILARGKSDTHCQIKETLLIRDLKPAPNEI